MRSQQLLASLIERMRALPQPIVCAVQASAGKGGGGATGRRTGFACRALQRAVWHRNSPACNPPAVPARLAEPQGAAAGAGFALAMASDVRIASRDAKFSAAFVRLGLTGALPRT